MLHLLQVVLPVFLVTGVGYLATRTAYLTESQIDGLNRFAQTVAIPCLLFRAAMELDLGTVFRPGLLLSYYTGSATVFFLGILGARLIFKRRPGEAVAIGFGALYSNSVILGIPIASRAFGEETLAAVFAVVSLHAPFCYLLGITTMEISRADGRGLAETARIVISAMVHNALMIGLALGFAINLIGITLPQVILDGVDLIVAAALPTALIALGGILTRYRIQSSIATAAMTVVLGLIVHPAIAYGLGSFVFDLPKPMLNAAVIIAAMAPGVNSYLFAAMYNRAEGAAASTVLLATALSVVTVSVWLAILG